MSVDKKILAFDIGTTGVKTCIVEAGETLRILAGASAGYGLYLLPDGGAEQDPDEWWSAMCSTARQVMEGSRNRGGGDSGHFFLFPDAGAGAGGPGREAGQTTP